MTSAAATILGRRELAPGVYKYLISCPEIAKSASAGQFVQVKAEGFFLRRPISLCRIDQKAGSLVLVMEVRGEGTAVLARLGSGDTLDLIGPLGRGFALLDPGAKAVAVSGGIGLPPLCQLAAHYRAGMTVFAGFRNAAAVILADELEGLGARFLLATDDGSAGFHGLVTAMLEEHLARQRPDIIYACGPAPMLKAVAALAEAQGVRCQVSLEERMACGMGACLGCACKTRTGPGEETYRHVCKDGPVFESTEVVW